MCAFLTLFWVVESHGNSQCVWVIELLLFYYQRFFSAGGKVKKRRRPHVLKIDVEGHDFEVHAYLLLYLQFFLLRLVVTAMYPIREQHFHKPCLCLIPTMLSRSWLAFCVSTHHWRNYHCWLTLKPNPSRRSIPSPRSVWNNCTCPLWLLLDFVRFFVYQFLAVHNPPPSSTKCNAWLIAFIL